jgi:hypothetical protein
MTEDELKELRRFHAEIEEYERNHPTDPRREAAEDAENLRMAERFPGELVYYTDAWDGTTLTRTILAHAPNWKLLREQLAGYPEEQLEAGTATYIDPPNQSLCTRALTGEIRIRADARREGE